MSAARRSLAGQIAANERWSRVSDRRAELSRTHAANTSSLDYWARRLELADPRTDAERAEWTRRAMQARRAHMQRLALKSAKARQARKTAPAAPHDGAS
jgi:hypothetical protein